MRNLINKKEIVQYIKNNYDAKEINTLNINKIITRYINPENKIIAVLDPTKLATEPLSDEEIAKGYKLIQQAIAQAKRGQKALGLQLTC